MPDVMPEGEDLRRAIKWISGYLKDEPGRSVQPLVKEAIFKFDLSPKDSDFLMNFFKKEKS